MSRGGGFTLSWALTGEMFIKYKFCIKYDLFILILHFADKST